MKNSKESPMKKPRRLPADALYRIGGRALVEIVVVVLLATVVNAVWDAAMSPYQAGAAAGQLADSNATYAASRAAATFRPVTVVVPIAFLLIVLSIVKAARGALAATKEIAA